MSKNEIIKVADLMQQTGVSFGTSGVRGRVVDMTDKVCWVYTTAFLQYLATAHGLKQGDKVGVAGDFRSSTENIMAVVAKAVTDMGFEAVNFGNIPSPTIALYGLYQKMPTIMVTGSHIPEDRNGIKFNLATGEILKADEVAIKAQQVKVPEDVFSDSGALLQASVLPDVLLEAKEHYISRFIDFFPKQCLQGKNIGLYEHSSVARECLYTILTQLGATVTKLGYSDTFVAVDTEAIRAEDVALAKQWAKDYDFDCIISTDGDGDRPLVSDEKGNWLRGDVAGILCAKYFNADAVVTPVSSNSALELSKFFNKTIRTQIGSPFVIAGMEQAQQDNDVVVGYEANGGFLLASKVVKDGRELAPLPTRDAVIVPLALLMLSIEQQCSISQLLTQLPARYTVSDRLKNFPTETSQTLLSEMLQGTTEENLAYIKNFLGTFAGEPIQIDTTDGVRILFEKGYIIHFRSSGNAPELRCYTEADTEAKALELNQLAMKILMRLS